MYFSIKHGDIPASYVIVYQRVNPIRVASGWVGEVGGKGPVGVCVSIEPFLNGLMSCKTPKKDGRNQNKWLSLGFLLTPNFCGVILDPYL